jgi:hypothetical protein
VDRVEVRRECRYHAGQGEASGTADSQEAGRWASCGQHTGRGLVNNQPVVSREPASPRTTNDVADGWITKKREIDVHVLHHVNGSDIAVSTNGGVVADGQDG